MANNYERIILVINNTNTLYICHQKDHLPLSKYLVSHRKYIPQLYTRRYWSLGVTPLF